MKIYCKYCWPTKRKYHFFLQLDYYVSNFFLGPFFDGLFKMRLKRKTQKLPQNLIWGLILETLGLLRVVTFEKSPNENQLYNRSLIFFWEAKKRGIDIRSVKFLWKHMNEFKFKYNGKSYYYEGIPLTLKEAPLNTDDKYKMKLELNKYGVPVAKGQLCKNLKQAKGCAQEIGYPLVVKPNNGSLSHHVVCNINSEDQLIEAVNIAMQYRPDFIVERYVQGKLFRATVIGKKEVYVCEKERANIIGDGESTIEELIRRKNEQQERGHTHKKNTTLHEIPIDEKLEQTIAKQDLTLKSVPVERKKVYLQDKFILSQGCDIFNCTKNVHEENMKLFLSIAQFLNADLLGIDFICPNIERSYQEQETAVLELNSLPYIDMHQNPSHGQADDVAKDLWDIVLENLKAC